MSTASWSMVVLWLARVWLLASAGLIAMMVIGHWPPPLLPRMLLFPVGVLAGMVAAWRWPLPGGLVTVGSLAAFYLSELALSGSFPRGPWMALIAAPGLLFIAYAVINARLSRAGTRP